MGTREQILSIRLISKLYAAPAYARLFEVEAAVSRPKGTALPERKEQS